MLGPDPSTYWIRGSSQVKPADDKMRPGSEHCMAPAVSGVSRLINAVARRADQLSMVIPNPLAMAF